MVGRKNRADVEYEGFVKDTVAKFPDKFRGQVEKLLSSPKAVETYGILKDNNLSGRVIGEAMVHGLDDFGRDRHLSPGGYATAVAEDLQRLGKYDRVIADMHDDDLLSDRDFARIMRDVKGRVGQDSKSMGKKGLQYLVRQAAVYILFIGGSYLILSSGRVITGAAVGVTAAASYKIFIGFIGLVLALALTKYKKTFDRDMGN